MIYILVIREQNIVQIAKAFTDKEEAKNRAKEWEETFDIEIIEMRLVR